MSNIVLSSLTYTGLGFLKDGIAQFIERSAGIVSYFKTITSRVSYGPSRITAAIKLEKPVHIDPTEGCCTATDLTPTIVDIVVRYDKMLPATYRTATLQDIKDLVLTSQFSDLVTTLVVTP